MYLFLKRSWNRLASIGLSEELSDMEQQEVRMLNFLILPGLFSAIAILLVFLMLPSMGVQDYAIPLVFVIIELFALWLQHLKCHLLARSYIIVVITLLISAGVCYWGSGMGFEFAFPICIVLPVLVFKRPRRQLLHLGIVATMLIGSRLQLTYFGPWADLASDPQFLTSMPARYNLTLFTCLALQAWFCYWYVNELLKSHRKSNALLTELQDKNNSLQQLNTEMESFAYIASHDLKTPLVTIIAFLGLIEDKIKKKEYDNLKEYLSYAKDGAGQMRLLISDILEFSRLDNAVDRNEVVDLNQVVSVVCKQLGAASNVRIEGALPSILSNKTQMKVLIQNLIENGLKYNRSDNPLVWISFVTQADQCLLHFRDNGIGIDPAHFERIFEMFKRLHTRQEFDGTGIGLSMCMKIAKSMGGSIVVDSCLNHGSTFTVSMPAGGLIRSSASNAVSISTKV